jgi:hypothetical protein
MLITEKSEAPETLIGLHKRALFSPHTIALIAMWLLTTVSLVLMLFGGVRNTGQFRVERYVLQAAYVLALFWYLIRTGPSVEQLPDLCPLLLPKLQIGKLIPVIVIALLFVAEFFGQGLLLPLLMLATIWILIAWRREIGLSAILLSLGITIIALLAGLPFYQNQYIGKASFIVLLVFSIPMFVAGGLLSKRTGLVGSQLYARRCREAVKSFLWGCLLFIPLGLANAIFTPAVSALAQRSTAEKRPPNQLLIARRLPQNWPVKSPSLGDDSTPDIGYFSYISWVIGIPRGSIRIGV